MPSDYTLGGHFEEFIQSMVASGHFANASEVVQAGLRLLEKKHRELVEEDAELDEFLAESFDDIEKGRIWPAEQVFDEILDGLRKRRGGEAAE